MTMRKALLGAALLASVSSAAMAQATNGFYIGGAGGATWLRDADVSGGPVNSEAEFDTGWGVIGAIGYGFGNGLRLEFEPGYRSNDIDKTASGSGSGDGATALSFMGNVLYDIQTGTPFTPYVGVGAGYARTTLDGRTFSGTTVDDDEDWNFAYQGIVGVAYAITSALKLTLDYRYFATLDPEYKTNTGVSVDSEYRTHNVMLGLRYEFGAPARPMAQPAQTAPAPMPAPAAAPPPPPPPAPSPVIQRTFLVFFDFNQSTITPEADRVIRQAAQTARQNNIPLVIATGHADRSGSDRYNQGLSERRAAAVREILISAGIPANQIQTSGRGETQPLVPTPDGVREPQNRRVEIVLQ